MALENKEIWHYLGKNFYFGLFRAILRTLSLEGDHNKISSLLPGNFLDLFKFLHIVVDLENPEILTLPTKKTVFVACFGWFGEFFCNKDFINRKTKYFQRVFWVSLISLGPIWRFLHHWSMPWPLVFNRLRGYLHKNGCFVLFWNILGMSM